jgi:hypothetical protein
VSGNGLGFLNIYLVTYLATCLAAFLNACLIAFLTIFLNACFTVFFNACYIRCIMRILLSPFVAEVSSGYLTYLRVLPAFSTCLPPAPTYFQYSVCYLQPVNEYIIIPIT